MKFKELAVGQSFDWINDKDPRLTSFHLRCVKTSARTYVDSNGSRHLIGSIHANVFHVQSPEVIPVDLNEETFERGPIRIRGPFKIRS